VEIHPGNDCNRLETWAAPDDEDRNHLGSHSPIEILMPEIVQNPGHMPKRSDIREEHLRVLSSSTRGYDRAVYRYLPISRG